MLCFSLLLLLCTTTSATNRTISWYAAAGSISQIIDASQAATTLFSCCNKITVHSATNITSVGITELSENVRRARAMGGLSTVHVVEVNPLLKFNNGTSNKNITFQIVQLVSLSNASGVMVDWEPSKQTWKKWGVNETRAVATAYSMWTEELAIAMHKEGLTVAVDLSGDCGGSPIDLFDIFAKNNNVDQFMLMATYRDIHDQLSYEKTLVTRALDAGIDVQQLSIGLGSISFSKPKEYGWDQNDLKRYVTWLEQLGINNLGIWRSDIDIGPTEQAKTVDWFVNILQSFLSPSTSTETTSLIPFCDVTTKQFGGIGDNQTDDTLAIQKALNTCSKVLLPSGFTFLLQPIQLFSNTHFQIDGNIAAWRDIQTWPNSTNKRCGLNEILSNNPRILVPSKESLLWGISPLTNLTISGTGSIDGQGWRWWKLRNDSEYWHHCRPNLLSLGQGNVTTFGAVSNIAVSGITLKNSPRWTINGRGLQNATFDNVTITTTGCGYHQSPNTDGFNLQGENIVVSNSFVRNGDDCVPIFPPSRNILVQNLTCTCGNPPVAVLFPPANQVTGKSKYFAGLIENVTFDSMHLIGTSSGLAIKSLAPFIGHAKNIRFTNLVLENVKIGMAINFFKQGDQNNNSFQASASSVLIENVTGTVVSDAGHIDCQGGQPCQDFRLVNVQLTSTSGGVLEDYSCMNASGTSTNCTPLPCLTSQTTRNTTTSTYSTETPLSQHQQDVSDQVSFNQTLFHVTLAGTSSPTPSCIHNRDVHLLTGTVNGKNGGTVNVHVVNGTMNDYQLIFGPTIEDRGFLIHNVTAHLPCNSSSMTIVKGYANCEDPSSGPKSDCVSVLFEDHPSPDVPPHYHWILSLGINPPLPPVKCNELYKKKKCDSISKCRWCTSSSKTTFGSSNSSRSSGSKNVVVDALCFTQGHLPPTTNWNCD